MQLTNPNIDNVIFRSIIKSAKYDEAIYGYTRVIPVTAQDRVEDIVAGFVTDPTSGEADPQPAPHRSSLSVPVQPGNNLYLIKLDGSARAAFGPGPNPIMVLPPKLGDELLGDIQLIFDNGGTTKFLAAGAIPNTFNEVPEKAVLAFTCDRTKLEQVWKSVMPEDHKDMPVAIPFYLNLYDTKTGAPVWAFLSHGRRAADHQHNTKHPETHGGIHPSYGPIHFVTHGGIHPGSPSQTLY